MSHKFSIFFLMFACFLGMSTSLWGQNNAAQRGIRGYLDPQTGAFHATPLPEIDPDAAPALTTYGGKLVVTFTVTVASTVAATAKIGCEVDAFVSDGANYISESGASAVARGAASTVVCKVTIPYSWKLATGGTDMISMSYTITSPVAVSTAAAEFPLRITSQSLASIKVPITGTTTTQAVAATI